MGYFNICRLNSYKLYHILDEEDYLLSRGARHVSVTLNVCQRHTVLKTRTYKDKA